MKHQFFFTIYLTFIIARVTALKVDFFNFKRAEEVDERDVNVLSLFSITNSPDVGTCTMVCFANTQCQSFFYNKLTGRCTTYSAVFKPTQGAVPELGAVYFVRIPQTCSPSSGYTYVGWLPICYRIYKEPAVNQPEGKLLCEADGGHLAQVDTLKKQQYLSSLDVLQPPSVHIFVEGKCDGGNILDDWKQDDGSQLPFVQWKGIQPNGQCVNNCLCVRSAGFNDIYCQQKEAVCCELDL